MGSVKPASLPVWMVRPDAWKEKCVWVREAVQRLRSLEIPEVDHWVHEILWRFKNEGRRGEYMHDFDCAPNLWIEISDWERGMVLLRKTLILAPGMDFTRDTPPIAKLVVMEEWVFRDIVQTLNALNSLVSQRIEAELKRWCGGPWKY